MNLNYSKMIREIKNHYIAHKNTFAVCRDRVIELELIG
jgi:hypothetical protein